MCLSGKRNEQPQRGRKGPCTHSREKLCVFSILWRSVASHEFVRMDLAVYSGTKSVLMNLVQMPG